MTRVALVAAFVFVASAQAADVLPGSADKAKEQAQEQAQEQAREQSLQEPVPTSGETKVQGTRIYREEERIGPNEQPRWTTQRRFPNTRIYVVPGGTATFEFWLATKHPLNDLGESRYRTDYELELGLGHRLQLDLYLETEQKGTGAFELKREKLELRYAFAKWGAIPGNPTLYLEANREFDGPVKGEVKLLLGGEVKPGLHWGANLVYEREFAASQEHEYALTGGLAWTLIDEVLSLGAEAKLEAVDERGSRFNFASTEALLGPSVLYHPIPQASVMLVALLGAEHEGNETTPLLEPTLIVGWTF